MNSDLMMDIAVNRLSIQEHDDLVASVDLFLEAHPEWAFNRTALLMDLTATSYRCPMDFDKLRNTDDFTRSHDIVNIHYYLDRQTFRLARCFVPRCTKRESEVPS